MNKDEFMNFLDDKGISYNVDGLKVLHVNWPIDLSHSNITSLPKGLSVDGFIDLSYSNITSLPEGLKVGGSLYLSYSSITSLPKGLSVGGSLDLSYSRITSLPEGLKVGERLILQGSNIPFASAGDIKRKIYAFFVGDSIMVTAGCFYGTPEEFYKAVDRKYGGSVDGKNYKNYKDKMADIVERARIGDWD